MDLAKTSILNGIAVGTKLVASIVTNKVLAVLVGPSGYAVMGQFQNFISIATSISGGLLANGITKTTAENYDLERRQYDVWKTAVRATLALSVAVSLLILVFQDSLVKWLLNFESISIALVCFALCLPAITLNSVFLSIANGKKEVAVIVISNIVSSAVNLFSTILLAYYFGLKGALVAFAINPAMALFITAFLLNRKTYFRIRNWWGRIDPSVLSSLSSYALMGLVSAIALPAASMTIRGSIVRQLGENEAGYWQAMNGISGILMLAFTSTLSVYYLPRLAEIRDARSLVDEIVKVYRFILPLLIGAALLIYFFRDFIIFTLLTSEFQPMSEMFKFQLIGDVLKITSWVLGYILIGRAMVKIFLITEIGFAVLLTTLTVPMIDLFGLVGPPIAYTITYSMHLIVMGIVITRYIRTGFNVGTNRTIV